MVGVLRTAGLIMTASGLLVAALPSASAARFCKFGERRYSVFATRCTEGRQMRCMGDNEWKFLRACKKRTAKKGSRFCTFGERRYSIFSTRCTEGRQMRCVGPNKWRYLRRCKVAAKKGSRFCTFGERRYTIHSTRCTDGRQMRCVGPNKWRYLRACREARPAEPDRKEKAAQSQSEAE